jgi:hypothetical protein
MIKKCIFISPESVESFNTNKETFQEQSVSGGMHRILKMAVFWVVAPYSLVEINDGD